MICKSCSKDIPDGAPFCPWCGKKQASAPRKHKKRANGSGTIWKRPGNLKNPWIARKDGIYIGSYISRVEAQKALDRLVDEDITGRYNYTFQKIYELWKPEHDREISKSQQANYATAYNHCKALYNRKFRNLRRSDFAAVIMQMEDEDYSLSSCEKVLQLFGQLSKWAIDEGIVTRNHAARVTTAAQQKKKRKPFTKDELAKIQAATEPAAMILRIMIATGCRGKDLFTAKLSDCKADYFISGSKTEAGYDRAIAVSDYGLTDYQTLVMLSTVSGGDMLISGYSGNRVYENWAKRDFADLRDALRLDPEKSAYNSRHTYATAAFNAGMTQDILKLQMGHEDIRTTDKIYNHADDQRIVSAGRKVKII